MDAITPVESQGNYFFKRDDYYRVADVCGGKARTCWALALPAQRGLVTAGSRFSPQCKIVAHVAHAHGIACHIHTTFGDVTPELYAAKLMGAKIHHHRPGHNNVIIKRARDDAIKNDYTEIPFGMECTEAIKQTAKQTENLPPEAKRIVIPVGSGMSLAGVLYGLHLANNTTPVLGVCVGASPLRRLDKYAPPLFNWRLQTTLVDSLLPYHEYWPEPHIAGIELDPIYEAKCLPYLKEGDLLWIVGIR